MNFDSSEGLIFGLLWISFGWVVFRSFWYENRPTLEDVEEEISPEEKKRRRRQNHLERLFTALFYVPFVPFSCIFQPLIMQLFVLIMSTKALGEYLQIISVSDYLKKKEVSEKKKLRIYRLTTEDRFLQCVALIQGIVPIFISPRFDIYSTTTFFCLFCLFTFHMLQVVRNANISRETLYRLALHMFGFIWISWTSFHIIIPLNPDYNYQFSGGLVAIMLWTSWIGDGAAYYVGSKMGVHKAFPNVSPKKSWEGIGATTIFSFLLCIGFKGLQEAGYSSLQFPPISMIHYIMLAFIISFFDILGDVCESFIKRLGGVKDSGTFFTGHGGILDRFDSFYFVAPATVYYLHYVILSRY